MRQPAELGALQDRAAGVLLAVLLLLVLCARRRPPMPAVSFREATRDRTRQRQAARRRAHGRLPDLLRQRKHPTSHFIPLFFWNFSALDFLGLRISEKVG